MRDIISQKRAEELHSAISARVIRNIEKAEALMPEGFKVRITQGGRSIEYQNNLYLQGRDKKHPGPIVTRAKGGFSVHNYFLAFDGAILENGKIDWQHESPWWIEVVKIFVADGFKWGADWDEDGITRQQGDSAKDEPIVDRPHLQLTFGYTVRQLKEKYDKKDFIANTNFVKL
jgi:peptidoglycan L-alanyl-D-glutamate endopeptidase CwlK